MFKAPSNLTLDELRRHYIFHVIENCKGNRTEACKILRISSRGLRYNIAEYKVAGHKVPDYIHEYLNEKYQT
jgi:DNA-binding NtrC family response regulator